MHLCQDEINAIVNGLPLVEHLTRYAMRGWCWLVAKVRQ